MIPRALRNAAAALAVAAMASAAVAQPASQADQQRAAVLQAFGGAYDGPMAAYVARIGERMAAAAGQGGRCRFTVLDTPVVNAMATPPGCEIYVTRGLLSLIRDEDELAAVLGHEVGHVAADHAGRRQTRSAITGLGAVILGAVTGSSTIASVASQVGQLNVLSYSRAQEFEADSLSARYLASARYNPWGLADMLSALQASDQLEALDQGTKARATPAWSSTHPLTGDRIARAVAEARRTAGPSPPQGPASDAYLAAVDGLVYGDDPAQGVVLGRRFLHPGLGIGFTAPEGFQLANSPAAVSLQGPAGQIAQFAGPTSGARGGDLADEAYAVLRRVAGQTPVDTGELRRTRVNGLDAVVLAAQARTSRGAVDVTVAVYAVGQVPYHFVTLAPAGQGGGFDPLIGSMRRLSEAERAEARPRRIQVVTVRAGDTIDSLAARMAVEDRRRELFLAINGLQPGDPLKPGDRVKIVTIG